MKIQLSYKQIKMIKLKLIKNKYELNSYFFIYLNMKNKYELNISNQNIHIKYYKEILDISSKQMKIKLNTLILLIQGENLIINKLDEYEISIIGKPLNIQLIYE